MSTSFFLGIEEPHGPLPFGNLSVVPISK